MCPTGRETVWGSRVPLMQTTDIHEVAWTAEKQLEQALPWLWSKANAVPSEKHQPFFVAISFTSNLTIRSRTDERVRTDIKEAKLKCVKPVADILKMIVLSRGTWGCDLPDSSSHSMPRGYHRVQGIVCLMWTSRWHKKAIFSGCHQNSLPVRVQPAQWSMLVT